MKQSACALLTLLLVPACGESHDPERKDTDPAAEACAHVDEAGTAITAATDRAAAPVLPVDEPVTVTMPSSAESWVAVAGPGDFLLFSKLANVVTGLYEGTGDTNVLAMDSPNEDCPAKIVAHFDLELATSGPWAVKLGPSAVSEAWLMLTPASGHGSH